MSYGKKRKRLIEWQRQIEFSHIFVIGENTIFVPTFSPHSHFGPYFFFFLLLLVPKIKNRSILIPIIISLTENSLHDKRSSQVNILNIKKSHIIIFHFL